jgi:hypothetical protein
VSRRTDNAHQGGTPVKRIEFSFGSLTVGHHRALAFFTSSQGSTLSDAVCRYISP